MDTSNAVCSHVAPEELLLTLLFLKIYALDLICVFVCIYVFRR